MKIDIENRTPDKLGKKFEIPVRKKSQRLNSNTLIRLWTAIIIFILLSVIIIWYTTLKLESVKQEEKKTDEIILVNSINELRYQMEKDVELVEEIQERLHDNKRLKDCYFSNLTKFFNNEKYEMECSLDF